MAELEITTVGPGLDVIIDSAASELTAESAKFLLKAATILGGGIAEVGFSRFQRSTGQLPRSFLPARFVKVKGVTGAAALSPLPHAHIQDAGGTIKPKTRKWLAIPLTTEAEKKWPRDWPKDQLSFVPINATKALLVEKPKPKGRRKAKKAASRKAKPSRPSKPRKASQRRPAAKSAPKKKGRLGKAQYVLKKSVKIPGYDYIKDGIEFAMPDAAKVIEQAAAAAIAAGLDKR